MSEVQWRDVELNEGLGEHWEVLKEADLGDGFNVVAGVTKPTLDPENPDEPATRGGIAVFYLDSFIGRVKLSEELIGVDIPIEEVLAKTEEVWASKATAVQAISSRMRTGYY